MKKLFTIIILGIALILPLYSQESVQDEAAAVEDGADVEDIAGIETQEKSKIDFSRKIFEIGFDVGAGFDNGFIGTDDIFRKKAVIDMSKIAKDVPKNGADINLSISPGFFINVKNIDILKNKFDFGFLFNIDGGIKMNISKSLFTLIAEGNINKHDSSGSISASGGIFTEMGLRGSTHIEVAGKPLYVGVKPSIFTPVVYIPSNSGIKYQLNTTKDDKEGIFVHTKGEINVYTPTSLENPDIGRFIAGPGGFDISLEGEYPLFKFLDVGAGISKIPFAPAELTNLMKLSMSEFDIALTGEDLLNGKEPEIPEIDFDQTYSSKKLKVSRLMRFDVYARYKPFDNEFLVLRPNLGFSVNVNKGDGEGFFNVGLEARLNLIDLFVFYIGTDYTESIWMHKAGLNLNLRAFELDFEAALRNQDFGGAFDGRGFNFNLGLRFGW